MEGDAVDLFDLSGQVALVTGGNGGIGLGMAHGLAAAGSAVVVWGRDPAKNATAESQLAAHGVPVLVQACDVADPEQVRSRFDDAVAALGKVDTCIANAAVAARPTRFIDQDVEEWDRVTRVALDGAVHTLRVAARHMVERGIRGSLVGVSSVGAVQGQPRQQHYSAAKAGLIAVMNGLAVELGRKGIRANSILPGFIRTPMTPMLEEQALVDKVLSRIPAGRWGEPEDFAGIAVYLASRASAYQTGTQLVVDGGYLQF